MSSHQGGRVGVTAWFVVANRAQRCEIHKPKLCLVGGRDVVLRADLVLVAIWSRRSCAQIWKPPSHPALCRQREKLKGCDLKRFSSAALNKCHPIRVGGWVSLHGLCLHFLHFFTLFDTFWHFFTLLHFLHFFTFFKKKFFTCFFTFLHFFTLLYTFFYTFLHFFNLFFLFLHFFTFLHFLTPF